MYVAFCVEEGTGSQTWARPWVQRSVFSDEPGLQWAGGQVSVWVKEGSGGHGLLRGGG